MPSKAKSKQSMKSHSELQALEHSFSLHPIGNVVWLLVVSYQKKALTQGSLSLWVGDLLKSKENFNAAVLGDFLVYLES